MRRRERKRRGEGGRRRGEEEGGGEARGVEEVVGEGGWDIDSDENHE